MTSAAEQNQPTVAQEYAYDQINRTSKEIRVLTLHSGTHDEEIRCSVSVVSLIDNPKYEALSYVWGDHQDKRMIYVNGCQTEITSNLDTALRYIRYEHEDRKLWIDALCINQGDDLEKTHQVSLMAEIFKMSTSAILWLGCSYKSTKDNTTKGLLPNTSGRFLAPPRTGVRVNPHRSDVLTGLQYTNSKMVIPLHFSGSWQMIDTSTNFLAFHMTERVAAT